MNSRLRKFLSAVLSGFCCLSCVFFVSAILYVCFSPVEKDAFESWCGEPIGEIQMVGAWRIADQTIEDENGKLWSVDTPLSDEDFYLLWIDDMGTSETEDDEIIKMWNEISF